MVELASLVLGQDDHAPCAVGEPLEHLFPRLLQGLIQAFTEHNDDGAQERPLSRTPSANTLFTA